MKDYLGMQFGYAYDQAGNVTNAGSITVENKPLLIFTNDAFNMQIARIWSNKVELIGTASTNATVTVNDQPCDRQAEKFRCWLSLPNLTDSFETNIIVYACSNNVVASNVGTLFVAKPTEVVNNSSAGYPLQDSRYALSWDGWSRLTSMESTNANPNFKLQFTYFADGQRATRTVLKKVGGTWETNYVSALTFDGWNPVSERIQYYVNNSVVATTNRSYLWALDLAGQKDGKWGQAAGGIGALISIAVSDGGAVTNTYFPFSDHQGTIHGLRDSGGQIVAQYFYAPYGALIGESGAARDVCPFRFQSQYYDRETGVYQWKKRYYDAVLCRWLSRDPLAEQADPNLFRFCGSDPVGRIDPLGLSFSYVNPQDRLKIEHWLQMLKVVSPTAEKMISVMEGQKFDVSIQIQPMTGLDAEDGYFGTATPTMKRGTVDGFSVYDSTIILSKGLSDSEQLYSLLHELVHTFDYGTAEYQLKESKYPEIRFGPPPPLQSDPIDILFAGTSLPVPPTMGGWNPRLEFRAQRGRKIFMDEAFLPARSRKVGAPNAPMVVEFIILMVDLRAGSVHQSWHYRGVPLPEFRNTPRPEWSEAQNKTAQEEIRQRGIRTYEYKFE